jgi:alanyl-tRNA synthetase
LKLLDVIIQKAKSSKITEVNGKDAFTLYDTFGFPLDLTELILKEYNLTLNINEFNSEMEQQKSRSRNAAAQEAGDWIIIRNVEGVEFVGYDFHTSEIKITRYRQVKTQKKTIFHLVFDKTPFYAESGGQIGDKGFIEADGEKISIIDTQKENNLIIHITEKLPSDPSSVFRAVVPEKIRTLTANNHSATHLLDHALREVLGKHVEQKGSLVTPDYLRFDFSHYQKVSEEELIKVQRIVNKLIRENITCEEFRKVPMVQAQQMGAIALFGEKYGEEVRVIKFGESIELCGGVHVPSTGQIGMFHILSESAISAGVRRIEAITADKVEELMENTVSTLKQVKHLLNNPSDPTQSIQEIMDKNSELNKQLEGYARNEAMLVKDELKSKIEKFGDINVISQIVSIENNQIIKDICFQLKNEISNLFLVLGSTVGGKANLTIMISENLVKDRNLNAGNIIRNAAKAIQGGGGGQPFYATAGGNDPSGLKKAFEIAKESIK